MVREGLILFIEEVLCYILVPRNNLVVDNELMSHDMILSSFVVKKL